MATQKIPLPSKEKARRSLDRTIDNIFSEEYVQDAFEGFPDPGDLPNPVGVDAGKVWTTDGLDGADWINAKPSLSDYQNVVVVDEGGKGDYPNFNDAFSTEGEGKHYIIFGNCVAGGTKTGAGGGELTTISGPGYLSGTSLSFYDMNIVFDGIEVNQSVSILGDTIDSSVELKNGAVVNGRLRAIGTGGVSTDVTVINSLVSYSGNALEVSVASDPNSVNVTLDNTLLLSSGSAGLYIGQPLGSCKVTHANISGVNSIETDSLSLELDITHTNLIGNVVSASVAAGNYSNTLNGITWPTIP